MCGIAGIASAALPGQPDLGAALSRMLSVLRHRGPDDEGCQRILGDGKPVAFVGNTRLAILDLSPAGHQPMQDPNTGNWIVLNGEIYNHLEVREALRDRSRAWRSRSDTETVLEAYAAWGPACLDRLRGMFAVALWDAKEKALWCARDRLGIKPFYYWTGGGIFAFASEVRALLASGLVPPRADAGGLASFVRFGAVQEPRTLVAGLSSLPAGHWMRARDGRIADVRPYWRLAPRPSKAEPGDAAREVRWQLERAVREHLLSDVPVAAFLSGGIDSSVVTSLAARASPHPVRTFTVGFCETALDESSRAQAVAQRHGTNHERLLFSDGDVARLVPEGVGAMDLPTIDGLNTFLVSRAAAKAGAKVVLSGLGGDELFGGYPSFRLVPRAQRLAPLLGRVPSSLRTLAALGGSKGQRAADMMRAGAGLRERYEAARALWSSRELEAFGIAPELATAGALDPGPDVPLATRVSVLELTGYMRNTLLRDSDVMSMAVSLELRVPFLDHELVQRCVDLGVAAAPGPGPKPLLRRAASDLLPSATGRGPKKGFVLPMSAWMGGPLRVFVDVGLERCRQSELLPGVDLGRLKERFEARRLSWARLWQFAVLGHWAHAHLSS